MPAWDCTNDWLPQLHVGVTQEVAIVNGVGLVFSFLFCGIRIYIYKYIPFSPSLHLCFNLSMACF